MWSGCAGFQTNMQRQRRELLRAGALSGLGLGLNLPTWLAGQAHADEPLNDLPSAATFGRAKRCIFLFMWGGPAHQDTWDLKPLAPAEIRGEFKPIDTNVPGIQISEHFPLLAQRTDKLCLVRSVTHGDVNHTTATSYLLTGHGPPPDGDLFGGQPALGTVISKLNYGSGPLPRYIQMRPKLENDVPRFIESSQGQYAAWLGRNFDPMTIDENPNDPNYRVGDFDLQPEITLRRLQERSQLRLQLSERAALGASTKGQVLDEHYRRAFSLLDTAVGKGAFDLGEEPAEIRDQYGRNPHGQSVLQARRLIERGVPFVTVFWPSDGIKNVSILWDTHSRNFVDLKERLMPPADLALSALLDDLGQRGMLEDTLIIWGGEFGRTPRVGQRNSDAGAGSDGRDHWPNCFSVVLAGAGVNRGSVYGASDTQAGYPAVNPVSPADLAATVYHLLGIPEGFALPDNLSRPLIINPGRTITGLLQG